MPPWYADPDLAPFGAMVGITLGMLFVIIVLNIRGEW